MNLIMSITQQGVQRIERIELGETPIVLGRDWSADVTVMDPMVEARHLQLAWDAERQRVFVSDLGSLNGTRVHRRRVDAEPLLVDWGAPIQIGDTQICLFDASKEVAPAIPRSPWVRLFERIAHFPLLIPVVLFAIMLQGFEYWLGRESFQFTGDFFEHLASSGLSIAALAIVITLFSRLGRRPTHFLTQLGFVAVVSAAGVIAVSLGLVLQFNTQDPGLAKALVLGFQGVAWCVLAMIFLSLVTEISQRGRAIIAVGLSVGIVASSAFNYWKWDKDPSDQWHSRSTLEQTTLPKGWIVVQPIDANEYQKRVDQLFEVAARDGFGVVE